MFLFQNRTIVEEFCKIANAKPQMKPLINTVELTVRKPYRVLAFKDLETKYGRKLAVELEEFMYILPDSYTKNILDVMLHPDIVKTNPIFITLLNPKANTFDVPNLAFTCYQ